MPPTWKDAGDEEPDRPKFGRRGIRWLRYHLVRFVVQAPEIRQISTEEKRINRGLEILEWYLEEYSRYITWTADEIYRGPGYSNWSVSVKWTVVRSDFARALAETLEEIAGPALAAALPIPAGPIDVDAALAALAAEPASPLEEPDAYWLLEEEDRDRFRRCAARIRRKTPRECRVCSNLFVGQVSSVTCGACLAAGQKRCQDCEEVFTAPHGKVRRCESCLAVSRAKAAEEAARRAKRRR